jgi:uncharacterized protein (DUF697 family)/uncharacterized tellurite resistance protein B-like protein
MPITEREALASLRLLVAVARADGTIHPDERRSLSAAIESLMLPEALRSPTLLDEPVDLDAEVGELASEEARRQAFRSAFFMAYADGACSAEESALLERLASALGVPADERAALGRTFSGRARAIVPTADRTKRIDDSVKRSSEVHALALRYGAVSAALGAFPVPGLAIATDLAVVALQLKMIHDVAGLWGHPMDREGAKSILLAVGLGTGARLAISNLAKIIPGWGSVLGATTSFVSTYTLAKVIDAMFGSGEDASPDVLRARFVATEAEARKVYADQEEVLIQSRRGAEARLAELRADLAAGRITQAELDEQVERLV